jgi:hypothetical protein
MSRARRRSALATWLAVLGGLAVAIGVAGLWAQRTLGDPDSVAALAGEILAEPEIRTELAVVIVDPALERAPRQIRQQREVILTTTEAILDDPRFVPLFQDALRGAATQLVDGDGAVRLDLEGPLDLVVVEVRPVSPEVADELATVDPPAPEIVSAARADRLRGAIAVERAASLVLVVGGAILAAIALLRGGPGALVPFGASLAGASLVLFGTFLFGRWLLLAGIEPAARAAAAATAWNIVLGDLRTAMLVSAAAGGLALVLGAALGRRPSA